MCWRLIYPGLDGSQFTMEPGEIRRTKRNTAAFRFSLASRYSSLQQVSDLLLNNKLNNDKHIKNEL